MSIKESIIKAGGVWMVQQKNNYKIVIDFNKGMFDTFDWYKIGELHQETTKEKIDQLLTNIKTCKKLK